MELKRLTLTARDGSEHAYMITPIPPSQSIDLALSTLACISKPGVRMIKLSMEAQGLSLDNEVEISQFIGQLDLSAIGADIGSVLGSLAARPDIVRRMFYGTFRDSKDLSDDGEFDLAYAGNWGELYSALKEIVSANGLLPFLDSLSS